MIKKVLIRNFQSHRKSVLNFVPGVNVIIGKSNNGKTAVLRSILWVINNRPLGFRYHSNFDTEDYTKVVLELDEGNKVELRKTKSEAKYKINDGDPFSGVGFNVPDQVSSLLNIGDINI